MAVFEINIRYGADFLFYAEKIIYAERYYIRLAKFILIPKVVLFSKAIPIFLRGHSASGKIINFCACCTCNILAP